MLQLNPGDKLPIIRQLNNPNDNTGYYVRAVVRNSLLQTVLQAINLTDAGGGRFEGSYLVPPADGTYFDITTKVYSDAGYTTQDTQYADENNQYLGALRWGLQYWNNGGGVDIDYKRITKIVETEVSKVKTLSADEVSAVVAGANREIKNAIESTHKAVTDIIIPEVKIPEQKEVDLSTVQNKLQEAISLMEMVKGDTGEIKDKEDNVMTAITGLSTENVNISAEILNKNEELKTLIEKEHADEMGMALGERNQYRDKLRMIQQSLGGMDTMNEKPDMKEPEDEMSLRVKNYQV